MTVYETHDPFDAFEKMNLFEKELTDSMIVLCSDDLTVMYGDEGLLDYRYIFENGINAFRIYHMGGAIVCFPGDISILRICKYPTDHNEKCSNALIKLPELSNSEIKVNNNDILVDGTKIAGAMGIIHTNKWARFGVHFSININNLIIDSICTKKREKIPGDLSRYGINANDIFEAVKKEYNI